MLYERYYFHPEKPFIAMATFHCGGRCDLIIWQAEEPEKMYPIYIPHKQLRHLEMDIDRERTDTLLKNFLEFDPEMIDHHDPNSFFRLDIGGEG